MNTVSQGAAWGLGFAVAFTPIALLIIALSEKFFGVSFCE